MTCQKILDSGFLFIYLFTFFCKGIRQDYFRLFRRIGKNSGLNSIVLVFTTVLILENPKETLTNYRFIVCY